MRSAWLLLLVLFAGLGLAWAGAGGSGSAFRGLAPLLGIAALAMLLDALLQRSARDLPLYRRHLKAFLLCAVAAALAGARRGGYDALALATGLLGAAVGLAVPVLQRLGGRDLAPVSWARGRFARPEPDRPLVLVADPHWSDRLVGLAETTRAHPEADWLFLGDVFDVWVGLPGMETEGQRGFLAWVAERRGAGRWVGLWMGNREYFLDGLAPAFDLLGEGVGGRLEGETLSFEHGDWINHRDWRYRLWNLVSRSGPMWAFFRLLPGPLARATARVLERKLRTTNRAYKLAFPAEAFEAAAQAEGERTFITGHFHTLERMGNGTALPWAHEGNFWLWRQGRLEPMLPPSPDSTSSAGPDPIP